MIFARQTKIVKDTEKKMYPSPVFRPKKGIKAQEQDKNNVIFCVWDTGTTDSRNFACGTDSRNSTITKNLKDSIMNLFIGLLFSEIVCCVPPMVS